MKYFIIYLIAINIIAFVLCLIDKRAAIKHKRRIRERDLFAVCFAGGCVGFWIGMYTLRHKTKHKSFIIGVPVIILIWAIIIVAISL